MTGPAPVWAPRPPDPGGARDPDEPPPLTAYGAALTLLLGASAALLVLRAMPVLLAGLLSVALLVLLGEAVLRLLPQSALTRRVARGYLAGGCGLAVLLLVGLVLATVLPLLGVQDPLRPVPVVLSLDVIGVLALGIGRQAWQRPLRRPAGLNGQLAQLHLGAALPLAVGAGILALEGARPGVLTAVTATGCACYVVLVLAPWRHPRRVAAALDNLGVAVSLYIATTWRGRPPAADPPAAYSASPPPARWARAPTPLPTRGAFPLAGPAARARADPLPVPQYAVALALLLAVNAAPLVFGRMPALLAGLLFLALLVLLGEALLRLLPAQILPDRVARTYVAGCCGFVVLLVTGLALNTALPPLGFDDPLRPYPVLLTLDVSCGLALWLARDLWRRPLPRPALRGRLPLLLSAVLPLAAVSGAIALDNGRSGALTLVMLVGCAGYLTALLVLGERASRSAALAGIYAVALALLLMTSMRGRYVTGHDIQIEYYVFELTHRAWQWGIGSYVDAYNSCLSVNIVPTMLVGILHVPDVMVFKLIYQLLFAACPVGVFLVAEQLAGRRAALLAALMFMAFPTFFTDMPMLNRQEMAFLLLSAMMVVVVQRDRGAHRTQVFVFFALGVGSVLSHYSTTYLLILQLGLAAGAAAVLRRRRPGLPGSRAGPGWSAGRSRIVTVPVVAALACLAFLWGGVITHTGGSLAASVRTALDSVATGGVTAGSDDASASLIGGSTLTPEQLLGRFVANSLGERQAGRSYPDSATAAAYPVSPVEPERAPLTAVGRALERRHIDVFGVVSATRTGSAKALQLLLALGVLVLVLRRTRLVAFDPEYALLALGALVMLALFVALPTLTLDYGLLRVFQQALIVLALPTALGCAVFVSGVRAGVRAVRSVAAPDRWPARPGPDGFAAAAVLPVLFLVSSTGILACVTGGYLPALHLANGGENYDSYVLHESELAAAQWLARQPDLRPGESGNAQADLWMSVKIFSQEGVRIQPVVVPGAIAEDSYVVAGYDNLRRGAAQGGLVNQPVSFSYPLSYLQEHRNLVYSTGQTEVFR